VLDADPDRTDVELRVIGLSVAGALGRFDGSRRRLEILL
jgi:hypothetical protein